ncbi:MAG: hypothetical protein ACYSOL_09235 [Planctomycetota bacterium]
MQEPFLDLPNVRIKKGSVRVGGTRTLWYLSLAPSEIVCEVGPSTGDWLQHPTSGGGGKILLFKPTYSRLSKFQISKIKVIAFHHYFFAAFITTPKAMFDDLMITESREKINENTRKPGNNWSV